MTEEGPRVRLFLAIVPPAEVRAEIAHRAARALDGCVDRVYVADDLHLTLVFLGDVERACAGRVVAGLEAAFTDASPIALRAAGTGSFGVAGHERALWAGFDLDASSRARLEDLVARGRALAARSGIELAAHELARAYVPHLTLARPRARDRAPTEFAALRFDVGWTADEVALCESAGAGARDGRYPVRASVRLRGG